MAEARCHYCTKPAQEECHTCGRLYCAEHGEDVCLRCLSPEAATPSPFVFRGAVFALAVAVAVTIYLVISPPQSRSSQDAVRVLPTATPQLQPTATPTPRGGTVPGGTTPAGATPVAATGTVFGSPTATPRGQQTYRVQPGDSLSGIAAANGVTVAALIAANPGLTEDIQIGQEIVIPAP
ncbi:MAG: LysM domain-containing protein [Dehalococcoidia bacterium]|nr:LysM peptidoglycan-binding domain-containing protein [Dehalococcoidia bacterium]MCB9485772.1 LysM peptidoglycan-binding domain-containing protein [Thermoflexaceae bacterium]